MTRTLLLLAFALALAGCAGSPWIRNFEGDRSLLASSPDLAPTLRRIEWSRLLRAEDERAARRAASDLHPDEWTRAQKDHDHAELLRGLQVSADPASYRILGRASFRSTSIHEARSLEADARDLGASLVIWSSAYVGKIDAVRSEPVTEIRHGTWSDPGQADADRRTGTYSETRTVYVPVRVSADEHAYIAWFLAPR